jgi:hypothetical protein
MMKYLLPLTAYVIAAALVLGCTDKLALAESSFGKMSNQSSKAGPTSVISMGRDDDDGKAKKWHIGGGEN